MTPKDVGDATHECPPLDKSRAALLAARAYAGTPRAAVILLGTSLGGGFSPPAAELLPLASDFSVS